MASDGRGTRLPDPAFWRGRDVLLTGHTGFKGSWMARWLALMGARVHGFAFGPKTQPSHFEACRTAEVLTSDLRADVQDPVAVRRAMIESQASVVIHLAAQALVMEGFRDPVGTFGSNVMGTVNLLEALRNAPNVECAVLITTDKVYRSGVASEPGTMRPYREDDELGGHDPYSSSKAMAEAAVDAFRALPMPDNPRWPVPIATARAGNVIGGGDWSHQRLIPDCVRAFAAGKSVVLRRPEAIRPWQHVLDPVNGYLLLAESLANTVGGPALRPQLHAMNFGPGPNGETTVGNVARQVAAIWGNGSIVEGPADAQARSEDAALRLDASRASAALGWSPRWGLDEALRRTISWYRDVTDGRDPGALTDAQISDFLTGSSPETGAAR